MLPKNQFNHIIIPVHALTLKILNHSQQTTNQTLSCSDFRSS